MKFAAHALFIFLVASTISATATAGLFRAYLSFNGNDGNPSTVGAPCRLLPAALAAVNDGGEIWMVDSANYNTAPVTISKSVKILAISGALGSLVANGGDAVIINAPGGTVTLRNLSVLNFNAGVNGITVQDAATVHLEKLSIDGFTTDASSCINMTVATTVRLYVDDSFIRECHIGVSANGTDPALSNRPGVVIDNTRIERSVDTGAATGAGVWIQGFMDVSLRNSMISRQDVGVRFDDPPSAVSHLEIINSELTRTTTGLLYNNTSPNGNGQVTIAGSQFFGATDLIKILNSATGGHATVLITDSTFSYTSTSGAQIYNTASDNNSSLNVNVVRSAFANLSNVAMDLLASNGSKIQLSMRDSTLSGATTLLKTAGSGTGGYILVDLVRTAMSISTTAIDHGFGRIRLDGTHVTSNGNDFVNNGSGNIVSIGNNFVTDNTNGSGFTYITPSIIAPK